MSATYLGSDDSNTHRTDYTPEWLGRLADDVTYQEFNVEAAREEAAR